MTQRFLYYLHQLKKLPIWLNVPSSSVQHHRVSSWKFFLGNSRFQCNSIIKKVFFHPSWKVRYRIWLFNWFNCTKYNLVVQFWYFSNKLTQQNKLIIFYYRFIFLMQCILKLIIIINNYYFNHPHITNKVLNEDFQFDKLI